MTDGLLWTKKQRGKSPRLYPGSLVWCVRKPGRDLREKVELWLAWKRVAREVSEGTLGRDFDHADRTEIHVKAKDAEEAAKDEVWGGYRFVVLADNQEADGLKVIDLGAGHSSSGETLCGRVVMALKSQALLNESVGSGYIDRNWPPALKGSGAWPLTCLRQSFLNGALTRLIDPDLTLRNKIVEFVDRGDFGLASSQKAETYDRVWHKEFIAPEEVAFESGVFLLTKEKAKSLKENVSGGTKQTTVEVPPTPAPLTQPGSKPEPEMPAAPETRTLHVVGSIPPEFWNRLGTKILPKLRSGAELQIAIDFRVSLKTDAARSMKAELNQALADLGLSGKVINRGKLIKGF